MLPRIAGDDALDELASVVGEDAARDLARHFGGTSLNVPRTIGDHHPICAAIGREAADLLGEWAGGSVVYVPKQAERRARVVELGEGALTRTQIARETGYSERHVYRLLAATDDYRQPDLFGSD